MSLPKELPTINFSLEDLKPGSSSWVSTCKQVRHALEDYGCFIALYQQVSPQLVDSIFAQARDLIEVPLENKVKNTSEEMYRGYIGPNPIMPRYESMGIENVTCPQETQKFRDLMWPQGKPKFCEITDLFAKLLEDLEHTVEKMLFENYQIPQEQYESMVSSNTYILRFMKYGTLEDSDTMNMLIPSHTDKNMTTILVQHDVGGLEVMTKDGDWISVEPAPSQLLFVAGDGLLVWSNDRVRACQHRVNHCGHKTRYSLGFFTSNDGVFQVPKELVDESHPLLCNQFNSRDFVRFYATEEGKKAESPIKAYLHC